MAAEKASAAGNTNIFQELQAYPWDKDPEFQGGLSAILGNTTSPSQIHELRLRAQCFYLSRKKSIPIDFDAYKSYLTSTNSTSTEPATPTEAPPHLQAPHQIPYITDLFNGDQVIIDAASQTMEAPAKEAPYPQTFAEIVALITSGAAIPGIRDIPDTILPSMATKPVEKKRRKPWEVANDIPEEAVQGAGAIIEGEKKVEGTFGDRRDEVIVQELPEGV